MIHCTDATNIERERDAWQPEAALTLGVLLVERGYPRDARAAYECSHADPSPRSIALIAREWIVIVRLRLWRTGMREGARVAAPRRWGGRLRM
jgi:hypothetical protein